MMEISVVKDLYNPSGVFQLKADLQIPHGKIIALYGASGSGKTTLLKMISGIIKPDSGKIVIDAKIWFDSYKNINLSPQERSVGFVFQDYALFPNMNVIRNIQFGMKNKKDKSKVQNLLELMKLKELSKNYPQRLSGGQKQRVALARAMAREPQILLLDEPLSALDYEIRKSLQEELLDLNRKTGLTIVIISHDLSEIFKIADFVILMEKGRTVRSGSPQEVFSTSFLDNHFRLSAEILSIEKKGLVYFLILLTGNQVIKIMTHEREIKGLRVGNRILVMNKAFDPILLKIETG